MSPSVRVLEWLDVADVAMDVRFLLDGAEIEGLSVEAESDGAEVTVTMHDSTGLRVFLLAIREVTLPRLDSNPQPSEATS